LTVEETQVFSLDGGGSYDPDGGSIVSYSWDFGDGSTSASGVSPSHSYSSAGTYDVTLTVTDDEAETGTDTVAVTVTQKTYDPPVANAGSNQGGFEGDTLTFNGADSYDPDGGDIVAYSWDFDGDGTEDAAGDTATHTFDNAGTYNVILTVEDDEGETDQDIVQVVITAVKEPPVADAGPDDLILLGESYTFDGTGSYDPDGGAIDFAWDFGDGSTGTGSTPSHTYGAYGVYDVSLQVTDDETETDTDNMVLQVTALPIADFQGAEDEPYRLDLDAGDSYDPDNGTGSGIVAYEWDFGDGSTGSGQTVSHTYSSADTVTVTLTVTDDEGQQDTVSVTGEIDGSGTLRIIVQ
jgi:PKD repeat protein